MLKPAAGAAQAFPPADRSLEFLGVRSLALKQTKIPQRPRNRWLIAIGGLKLIRAVFFLLLGFGALKLLHKDLVEIITHWFVDLRFDPEGRLVNLILDQVATIDDHRLRLISTGIFCYAALDVIEGAGLVLEKAWAEYLTFFITASFLPWEMFEILRRVTTVKIVLTLVNLAVVAYLAWHLQRRIREKREWSRRGSDSGDTVSPNIRL